MKVTFDGAVKLIIVDEDITALDVQADLYSTWKEWVQMDSNAKYLAALRTVGGDPTVGVKSVAPYFFLMNGWKIRPYEGNHTLIITGNLFVDEPETYGSNITVTTIGDYQVLVNMATTSDAITILSGSGVTTQDKQDIINGVWDERTVGHSPPDSFGEIVERTESRVKRVAGLSQENFRLCNQVYQTINGRECLTHARVKIYEDAEDLENDVPFGEYLTESGYDSKGNCISYVVKRL